MNKINFTERLKNLLLFPSYEWKIISLEKRSLIEHFSQFIFNLILVGAVTQFIGSFLYVRNILDIDAYRFSFPLVQAVFYVFMQIFLLLAGSFFVNQMAPSFGSVKLFKNSALLVFYSSTPLLMMYVIANLNPTFFLALIPGLYALYLFWGGLPLLLKTKESKRFSYVLLYFIFQAGILWGLSLIFGFITKVLFPA
ncbi:MAG: hypothetical protein K0B15_01355 [Lentimicrobium sp.]|nr:hypothetical protein [Lentimicrobium sp.]